MVCIFWENGPTLTALCRTLEGSYTIIGLDAITTPDAWIDLVWADDIRLLVHVNFGKRRSRRSGLELVQQLRWEWGVTAPVLFVSFETEETLQATPHGDLLTQPGHGFLRLPATGESIRQALHAVTPVAKPERYRRSAAASALGIFLDGPAAEPLNDGPGPTITLLDFLQNGTMDRAEVAECLTLNPWWQQWKATLSASRKRLAGLKAGVIAKCYIGLGRVEEHLATITTFAEQTLSTTWDVLTSQDLTTVINAAEKLLKTVQDLNVLREVLKAEVLSQGARNDAQEINHY